MKKVVKETNPEIIDKLAENFVEDGVYTKEIICKEFRDTMIYHPDLICVLVGYDDDKIVGHLIAYKPDNRQFVFLGQAWNIAENEHAREGFEQLKEWTKSLGLKEIRFETERASVMAKAVKNWGFTSRFVEFQMKF